MVNTLRRRLTAGLFSGAALLMYQMPGCSLQFDQEMLESLLGSGDASLDFSTESGDVSFDFSGDDDSPGTSNFDA